MADGPYPHLNPECQCGCQEWKRSRAIMANNQRRNFFIRWAKKLAAIFVRKTTSR